MSSALRELARLLAAVAVEDILLLGNGHVPDTRSSTDAEGSGELPSLIPSLPVVYMNDIYHSWSRVMSDTGVARIFMHGRSQAVRLPLAFRLPGDRVRVRRVEGGILLEPMVADIKAWFAEMDRFADVPFMPEGRKQPPMPKPKDLFK